MRNKIEQLVAEELARAKEKFPGFHSNHEAYAVLLEEVEELQEAAEQADFYRGVLWDILRGKNGNYTTTGGCDVFSRQLRVRAINAAEEAIQVSAMCDRWQEFLEKG